MKIQSLSNVERDPLQSCTTFLTSLIHVTATETLLVKGRWAMKIGCGCNRLEIVSSGGFCYAPSGQGLLISSEGARYCPRSVTALEQRREIKGENACTYSAV